MENTLCHYGILGMKWGVRRTPEQLGHKTADKTKQRVQSIEARAAAKTRNIKQQAKTDAKIAKAKSKAERKVAKAQAKADAKLAKARGSKDDSTPKSKPIEDMSDSEIKAKIDRIRLENQLKELQPRQVSKGQAFVDSLTKDVLVPALQNVGKQYVEKSLKKTLGLNEKNELAKLAKEAEKAGYERKIAEAESAKRKNERERQADEAAKRKQSANSTQRNTDEQAGAENTASGQTRNRTRGSSANSTSSTSQTDSANTVYGEGRNRYYTRADTVVDVDYSPVSETTQKYISAGKNYVAGLLEEQNE